MKRNPLQNPQLRPHETVLILKILKTLEKTPNNTMAIYRKLQSNPGFRNPHSFYRQFRFCLKHKLIKLSKVEKKWGIPTKTYSITKRGKNLLLLFGKTREYL